MREASGHSEQGWALDAAVHDAADSSGPAAGVALLDAPSVVDVPELGVAGVEELSVGTPDHVGELETTQPAPAESDGRTAPLALWYLRFPFDLF
jgi:hypothetical protein